MATRTRDAERSRSAILDAAEDLFAARGYDATGLGDIAAAAGLSRGTPSYFFGSKEQLYIAVLERVFAEREEATRAAFAQLADPATPDLRGALRRAVHDYMAFLLARPAFVRLLNWEELGGGRRLQATPRASRAMRDAFAAVRARPDAADFDVDDAILLTVTLAFAPLAQRDTFLTTLGRDLTDPDVLARHVDLVADHLHHLVTP